MCVFVEFSLNNCSVATVVDVGPVNNDGMILLGIQLDLGLCKHNMMCEQHKRVTSLTLPGTTPNFYLPHCTNGTSLQHLVNKERFIHVFASKLLVRQAPLQSTALARVVPGM